MSFGGAPPTSYAFEAAKQCTAATTRDGCAAVGAPILLSPEALALAQSGKFAEAVAVAEAAGATSGAGGPRAGGVAGGLVAAAGVLAAALLLG